MKCDYCRQDAILAQTYSGRHLCDRHIILDVERRAKHTIRIHGGISRGDRVAIVVENETRGRALIHFLATAFGARRDLSFFIVTSGKRNTGKKTSITGLGDRYGFPSFLALPGEMIPAPEGKLNHGDPEHESSTERGFRDILSIARRNGATRVALDSTVDDEADDMLREVLCGILPISSPPTEEVSCIRPFIAIPEQEVILYASLVALERTPTADLIESHHDGIRFALEQFSRRHPATPFALARLKETLARHTRETPSRPMNPDPWGYNPGGISTERPEEE